MKLTCLQENLKQALSSVSHVVSKNINLPVLSNILFLVEKGLIKLKATNLEMAVIYDLRGKIDQEGDFLVDARLITDYVSLLKQGKIEMEMKEKELFLNCDNYKTKIKTQETKEFPLIPVIEKNQEIKIPIFVFKKALSQVIFSVSNNENRPELAGVLFSFYKDILTIVATDSYRLAEAKIKINSSDKNLETKIIVPVKALQELSRLMALNKEGENIDDDGEIKINFSENQILFSFSSTEIFSRLIIGNYPEYEAIMPKNFKTNVLIDKQEFSRAIKAAAVFSKTGINEVNLVFNKEKEEILISSSSHQSGESFIKIGGEISGASNDIVLNHRFILDGLNNNDSQDLELKIVDSNTPCILKSKNEEDYLYVIMPIRQ